MSKVEKSLARLNAAIDRIEAAAGALAEREHAIRTEAAETVGAALDELRRAAGAMQETEEGRSDG